MEIKQVKAVQGQMRMQKHILNVSCPGLSLLLCSLVKPVFSCHYLCCVLFEKSPLFNLRVQSQIIKLEFNSFGSHPHIAK